ncbi:hypothetical protein KW795_00530 [Candidatus Microgenomates bacterium]|nr:hypothetical protein [Candidatus Microgenomates bacterium]
MEVNSDRGENFQVTDYESALRSVLRTMGIDDIAFSTLRDSETGQIVLIIGNYDYKDAE